MRTFKVGLVGAGFMGEIHARGYSACSKLYNDLGAVLEIGVVADPNEQAARALSERWKVPSWTTDWQAVVGDSNISVVDICTPPANHKEVAIAAIQSGLAVYCENPVGLNARETEDLASATEQAQVTTFVGFNYRWIPAISLAREVIRQGTIGDIVHVQISKDSDSAVDPSKSGWRFFAETAGHGSLGDVGSHVFDVSRSLAGDISSISGMTKTVINERPFNGGVRKVDTDDLWMALAEFENGATGNFQGSRVLSGHKADFTIDVTGTRGAIHWDQRHMNELAVFETRSDGMDGYRAIRIGPQHPDHGRFVPVRGHAIGFADLKTIEIARFTNALANSEPSAPNFSDALAVARIIEAVPLRKWVSLEKVQMR